MSQSNEKERLVSAESGNLQESPQKEQKRKLNIKSCVGIFMVVLICLCDITSIACLQLISHLPPDFELNTLRFTVGLMFVVIYLLSTQQVPRIKRELFGWVILVALATYFYNVSIFNKYIRELAIGAVFGIKQGFFLVLIAVSSRILLNEKHSWIKCLLTFTCFLGVVLVTISSVMPSYHQTNSATRSDSAFVYIFNYYIFRTHRCNKFNPEQ